MIGAFDIGQLYPTWRPCVYRNWNIYSVKHHLGPVFLSQLSDQNCSLCPNPWTFYILGVIDLSDCRYFEHHGELICLFSPGQWEWPLLGTTTAHCSLKQEAGKPSRDAVNSYHFMSSCQSSCSCQHCPDVLLLWIHHGSDPGHLWLLVTQSWSKARPSVQLQKSRCCQTMHFSCCGLWRVTHSTKLREGNTSSFSVMNEMLSRDIVLDQPAPSHDSKRVHNPVTGWLSLLSPPPRHLQSISFYFFSELSLMELLSYYRHMFPYN